MALRWASRIVVCISKVLIKLKGRSSRLDEHVQNRLGNLDPEKPVDINADITGMPVESAKGQTLTASQVDSVNTFGSPNNVVPKPISASVTSGKLTLTVEPKSVTVISLEP